jgi:hypothetical protein
MEQKKRSPLHPASHHAARSMEMPDNPKPDQGGKKPDPDKSRPDQKSGGQHKPGDARKGSQDKR